MKTYEYKIYLNGKQIESSIQAVSEGKVREILKAQYGDSITFGYIRLVS